MPVPPTSPGVDRRGIGVLAAAHVCSDLCQGAVPALLPFLIRDRGLTYAAAAALVLATSIGSSMIQPLFGYYADRIALPWLMPAGVLVGGVGIALTGLAPSYEWTFAAVVVSGIGVAAFHPEAARYANYVSGSRRASGMSVFSVGGNAGFALGPILVTPLVLLFGLPGTLLLAVGPALVALALLHELPRLMGFRPAAASTGRGGGARADAVGPFVRLTAAVSVRSAVYFGLQAFVPVWFVSRLGGSEAQGNAALAVMLVSGAVGTLVGGRVADRIGRRPVLVASMAVLTPLIGAFLLAGPGTAVALLALIGFAVVANFSITVVMGQEYLPSRLGLASGVIVGLAIGIGGLVAAGLGALADAFGLQAALWTVAALPLLALALSLTLPSAATPDRAPSPATAAPPRIRPTAP